MTTPLTLTKDETYTLYRTCSLGINGEETGVYMGKVCLRPWLGDKRPNNLFIFSNVRRGGIKYFGVAPEVSQDDETLSIALWVETWSDTVNGLFGSREFQQNIETIDRECKRQLGYNDNTPTTPIA